MKNYLIYVSFFLFAACGGKDEKADVPKVPDAPLTKSVNSEAFNRSFELLLNDYYILKDDFVAEKDAAIQVAAIQLMRDADSLHLAELKADSTLIVTAQNYATGIASELKGLLGEKEMEQKRKAFQMVSDQLYDLIRTVQYDRAVVYHDFCPMAFNEQGANWLSNTPDIRNPYMPKKMLTCGEVKDSIDFRQKK